MSVSEIPKPTNSIFDKLKNGDFNSILANSKDLLLPVGLLLILATLFIPLPPWSMSFLVLINLAFSITVLLTALFINSPVQLTTYPVILLLSTIFRLTISVSITRNILTFGEAGDVVEALGRITAQGNIITGAVMFIIILVVQFLVVGNGSQRVAEVAARFSLDAMPGKQMAIDADLRAGLISQEQALQQRKDLQRESQLHGAMDGAMKFVKGDSIATIIIALINITAGLATGVLIKELPLGDAVQKYTILTFGDGLAAIISSLLITISAGIVVTRVSSTDSVTNVGADIAEQLFTDPKPLYITGGVMLLLTPLNFLFIPVGLGAVGFGYVLKRRQSKLEILRKKTQLQKTSGEELEKVGMEMSFTVPMAVAVSQSLNGFVDKKTAKGAAFRAGIPKLRSALYYDLGVMVPFCFIGGNAPLRKNEYYIAIKEVPVSYGSIRPDCVYVNDSAENIEIFGLAGENFLNPADLSPGAWIPSDQKEIAKIAGLKVWEPEEVILLHLSRIMKKYAPDFLGIHEAQGYLDFVARTMPNLVEEVVPKIVSINQFTDVLQRLVGEGISIRDTKSILDSLSEAGRIEKDPVLLAEHVRASLKRYISFRFSAGRDILFVHLLDPEIEDVIREGIRKNSNGTFLSLDPEISNDILESIRKEFTKKLPTAQEPVIVTDMELRRFVRKIVEIEFPNLPVLSYQELTPELTVQPIGRISIGFEKSSLDLPEFNPDFEEIPDANSFLLESGIK